MASTPLPELPFLYCVVFTGRDASEACERFDILDDLTMTMQLYLHIMKLQES